MITVEINQGLPFGTYLTWIDRGDPIIVKLIEFNNETGFEFGNIPPIGTKVVKVAWKGKEPNKHFEIRDYLVYNGIKGSGFNAKHTFIKDKL